MLSNLVVEVVQFSEYAVLIQAIRRQVFQCEQGVDPNLDLDGLDATALQILAVCQDQPIGTARIRMFQRQSLAKIERLAVLQSFRKQGVGTAIMGKALSVLALHNVTAVILHAQLPTWDFYRRLGFEALGDPFEEATMLHIKMSKQVGVDV